MIIRKPVSLKKDGGSASTSAITIALRERILSGAADIFLGSEADLLDEYCISRPTFRQVARVLEQQELLVVRRGVGGGYYTRHPSIEMVGTVSGDYLRSHNLTVANIMEVLVPLSNLLHQKAASSDDDGAREQLVDIRRRMISLLNGDMDIDTYLLLAKEHAAVMITMAKNPLIGLQLSVLDQLARSKMARSGLLPTEEQAEKAMRLRVRLIDAIQAREVEVARAVGQLMISSVLATSILKADQEI